MATSTAAVVGDKQEEEQDDDYDDNIAIIYKEDSVGKDVWIKFPVVEEEEDDGDGEVYHHEDASNP